MRSTTISSSIASVVTRVIDSVAVAGSALRMAPRLMLMREHLGYWLTHCQPESAYEHDQFGRISGPQMGNKSYLLRLLGKRELAVCPTPTHPGSGRRSSEMTRRHG